jgi:hypothetical protein
MDDQLVFFTLTNPFQRGLHPRRMGASLAGIRTDLWVEKHRCGTASESHRLPLIKLELRASSAKASQTVHLIVTTGQI